MRTALSIAFAVWIVAVGGLAWAGAKAFETPLTLPTYPMATDDPYPQFPALGKEPIYPYTMQDGFGQTKEDRTYRSLVLENRYLRVTFLPALGGKLYGALDKTTGHEMFYRNPVVCPGHVAMRGAWTSGGVEWNAGPRNHTVTAFSPVDILCRRGPNGTAEAIIANTDRITRNRWCVHVRLDSESATLHERIHIMNPNDRVTTMYFWNNAAFPEVPGSRFIFPMSLGTDHGLTNYFTWPEHEGVDLSWVRNHRHPSSIFAVRCDYGFFGAYDADRDVGVLQTADPNVLLGKKAWTWGQMQDAIVSQAALTDDDSRYIEIQSGPLPTQSDFAFLYPQQSRTWTEVWRPVHGFGDGVEFANDFAAFQTHWTRNANGAEIDLRVLTAARMPRARLVVTEGSATLLDERLALGPESPVKRVMTAPNGGPVNIAILDPAGEAIAAYRSPLAIPKVEPPAASKEKKSTPVIEKQYLEGVEKERALDHSGARAAYEKALAMDAGFAPALRALATLDLEEGHAARATERLQQAVSRVPHDGWAWYFLGVAQLGLAWEQPAASAETLLREAAYSARMAAQEQETLSVGHDLLGRVAARQGRFEEARRAFEEAFRRSARNTRIASHLAMTCLELGEVNDAKKWAHYLTADEPLDYPAQAVAAFTSKNPKDSLAGLSSTMGDAEFAVTETALAFAELGLFARAVQIVEAALVAEPERVAQKPMAWYWLAFLKARAGAPDDAVDAALAQAAKCDAPYVFPSRPEEIAVLAFAVAHASQDGQAHLALGNLYAGLGRLDEARASWENALSADDQLAGAARNLGLLAWKRDRDFPKAIEQYRRALSLSPKDEVLAYDLAQLLVMTNQRADAVLVLERVVPARRSDIPVLLARTYLDLGRADDALALLAGTTFSNRESATAPWEMFNEAQVARGRALFDRGDYAGALAAFEAARTYPENLGVGKPEEPSEAYALYWTGRALNALGRSDEAKSAWKQGAAGPEGKGLQNQYRKECAKAFQEGAAQ